MLAAAGVLMILASLFGGKLVNRVHLPSITGWVIVGLLLGPSCLRVLTFVKLLSCSSPLRRLALAVIALAIMRVDGALSKEAGQCDPLPSLGCRCWSPSGWSPWHAWPVVPGPWPHYWGLCLQPRHPRP